MLTALRCLFGRHDWPDRPTTTTYLHAVYVCPHCFDIKQVDV